MSFTDETSKKVRDEFDRKRKAAQDDADARRAEIHSRIPDIELIDKQLANTGLALYNCAINGEDIEKMVSGMKEKNAVLRKMRAELLLSGGYSEDYTKVRYECEVCSDTGYDGLHYCDCFRRAMIKEAYLSSGLGGMLSSQGFDNFSLSYYSDEKGSGGRSERDTMKTILAEAKKYADSFGEEKAGECKNLIFFGSTGLGKTHISTAIAKTVIEKGFSVVYDTSSNILAAFENEKFSKVKTHESQTEKYMQCDLLIIDDLGAEFQSQFTQSALFNLLNTRICAGRAMIISTNLNDGNLLSKTYSERITSRLIGEFRAFRFVGNDVRLMKRQSHIKG